jgi:uncharacterized protein YqeY
LIETDPEHPARIIDAKDKMWFFFCLQNDRLLRSFWQAIPDLRNGYNRLNFRGWQMLIQQITDEMKQAMKAGEKLKLGAIRMLRAALKDKEIELGNALSEEDVIAVIGRMIKQRKDAANQYREAGRDDLAAKELEENHVYETYMPAQLSEEEIAVIVAEAVASSGAGGMRDMGKVMGVIRPKLQGKADMGMVSALVKQKLQG